MKTRLKQLAVFLMILVLSIPGCSNPATQPPPTQTPVPEATATQPPPTETPVMQATPTANLPSATVLDVVERINADDIEGALAYYADDAMLYIVGLPPTGIEVYQGKEQLRSFWEDNVSNHFQWEVEISSVVGDVVTAHVKTWHDFTRELGVAPLEWLDVYEVKDGKITTYSGTITEEALARLKPALAEVMPPEPPAAPSSETPVSEMTVTIAGGTCTADSPMVLQAGEVQVTLDVQDQDNELYALTFFTLDPDKDVLDLMASTVEAGPPSWSDMILFEELASSQTGTYSMTVEEGPVYGVCWSQPPDLPIGALGPFTVGPDPAAAPPTPAPEGPVSEMTITFSEGGCTYDGSMTLLAGEMTVTADVKDVDKEEYMLTFFNLLDPDKTFADLMAATSGDSPPDWVDTISEKHLGPGENKTYSFTVEVGPVYLICWSTPPDRPIGKKGPFEVEP
jgi:ketosteroid isomerase-like protein